MSKSIIKKKKKIKIPEPIITNFKNFKFTKHFLYQLEKKKEKIIYNQTALADFITKSFIYLVVHWAFGILVKIVGVGKKETPFSQRSLITNTKGKWKFKIKLIISNAHFDLQIESSRLSNSSQ